MNEGIADGLLELVGAEEEESDQEGYEVWVASSTFPVRSSSWSTGFQMKTLSSSSALSGTNVWGTNR